MKFKLALIPAILVLLVSCSSNHKGETNTSSEAEDSANENLVQNEELPHPVSYDSLIFFVENSQPLPCSYLDGGEDGKIKCPLEGNRVVQESEKYIILRSMHLNQAMDSYPYYLCSFSKETGKLLSFVPIGVEAEGVAPNTIRWKSDHAFTMVEYQYDFVEDEESGAYLQGGIKDSVVSEYLIDGDGEMVVVGGGE